MIQEFKISVGETIETTERSRVDKLVSALQTESANIQQWITGEYLRTKDIEAIEYALNQRKTSLASLDATSLARFCETGPAQNLLKEIQLSKQALLMILETRKRAGRDYDAVLIAHSDQHDPPGFRVMLIECEPETLSPYRFLLSNLHQFLRGNGRIRIGQESMLYFYTPAANGCDEITLYRDRDSSQPVIKKEKIRWLWFRRNEMGDEVVQYRDKKGVTRYTGADIVGAQTFRKKAAFFGIRIRADASIRNRVIAIPIRLIEEYLQPKPKRPAQTIQQSIKFLDT